MSEFSWKTLALIAAIAFAIYVIATYPAGDDGTVESEPERSAVRLKTVEERAETLAGLRGYVASIASSTSREQKAESLQEMRELLPDVPQPSLERREARLRAMRNALQE